jgi:hypothetical protein
MQRGVLGVRGWVEDVLVGGRVVHIVCIILEGGCTVLWGLCWRLEVVNQDRWALLRLGRRLARNMRLFKGPPFVVLFVSATRHGAASALVAGGLGLIALETLVLASDAACRQPSACAC